MKGFGTDYGVLFRCWCKVLSWCSIVCLSTWLRTFCKGDLLLSWIGGKLSCCILGL